MGSRSDRAHFGGPEIAMEIAIAIMAGGAGRRMGRDKALLELDGKTLLERIAGTALETGRSVVVIGRERPPGWDRDDILFIPDDVPGAGPLAAIATALRHLVVPVLALACDLPLMTTSAIRWLLDEAPRAHEADGIVVLNNGRPEPLFSVYFPSALPHAEMLLASNRRALRDLLASGTFPTVDAPPEIIAALVNVNTPEEWGEVRSQK